MNRKFYNKNTKFDPNYRNIQSELWVFLSEGDITVGAIFHMILNRAFGVEIEELFPELNQKGGKR